MNEKSTEVVEGVLPGSIEVLHPGIDRPPLLMEFLPEQPYEVLKKVFFPVSRCLVLKDSLKDWLNEAAFNEVEEGEESTGQLELRSFYQELAKLFDALHSIHRNKTILPSESDPWQTVCSFCEKYSRIHVRRELWCLLQLAMDVAFHYPGAYSLGDVLDWYEEVLGLVEAGYVLCELECV